MYGYRGLGLSCPGDPGCPGNVQPDVAPAPDVQQQIADVWSYLWNQPGAVPAVAAASVATPTSWLNANAKTVAIVAAVGLGLVMFAKAGR